MSTWTTVACRAEAADVFAMDDVDPTPVLPEPVMVPVPPCSAAGEEPL